LSKREYSLVENTSFKFSLKQKSKCMPAGAELRRARGRVTGRDFAGERRTWSALAPPPKTEAWCASASFLSAALSCAAVSNPHPLGRRRPRSVRVAHAVPARRRRRRSGRAAPVVRRARAVREGASHERLAPRALRQAIRTLAMRLTLQSEPMMRQMNPE